MCIKLCISVSTVNGNLSVFSSISSEQIRRISFLCFFILFESTFSHDSLRALKSMYAFALKSIRYSGLRTDILFSTTFPLIKAL